MTPSPTTRPVIWTEPALDELDAIHAYLVAMNPPAAARVAQEIVKAADSLQHFPMRGRMVRGGREVVTVPPYLIRYQAKPDAVVILGVRHGARRPRRS